ncbi:MAG: ABC transporter substrate-binding protein [Thiolinea sp.]
MFYLDERATFQDGKPIRPEDVKFTFNKLIEEGLPGLKSYYGFVDSIDILDDNRIRFNLSGRHAGQGAHDGFVRAYRCFRSTSGKTTAWMSRSRRCRSVAVPTGSVISSSANTKW